MRVLAVIVIILGLAALVLGILFIPQASSGEKEIADSIAPLTLDKVSDTYDQIDQQVKQMQPTDPQYLTYFAKRTSLGLAKANIGVAKFVRTSGTINIIVGLGLVLAGFVLLRKSQSAA